MIFNQFLFIYITVAGFAMAMGLVSIFQGVLCLKLWTVRDPYEKRYALEKRIYALMAVFVTLFVWRLLAIPLWFGTLKSLIPSIPGAMCIYGVVAASPLWLGGISLGQIMMPFLLAVWFIWRRFDHQLATQPLLKSEIILGVVIGVGITLLSAIEIGGLACLKPRVVNCCTSLFDHPNYRMNTSQMMGKHSVILAGWWMVAVFIVAGWLSRTAWQPAQKWFNAILITLTTGIGFGATLFFLIETLAPRILRLPLHHCPFCLLERSLPALLALIAWYGALVFLVSATWAVYFNRLETAKLIGWIQQKEGWALRLQTLSLLWFLYAATA